jgi:hypothetical protein
VGADSYRPRSTATPGECGQRVERGPGAAVPVHQQVEGVRPHMVATDEPQPVDALLLARPCAAVCVIGPARHGASITQAVARYNPKWQDPTRGQEGGALVLVPIFPSVPDRSRSILPRCLIHSSVVNRKKRRALFRAPENHIRGGVTALATSAASEE